MSTKSRAPSTLLQMVQALDFEIINAMEIHPRIAWAQLGDILNVDSTTLSRHWNRMAADGIAWTACYQHQPGGPQSVSALVEVSCIPGQREEVITRLCELAPVFSIHCTSGARDLYLSISGINLLALDRYVAERIAAISGISATRTHYLRSVFREGSKWRMNVLGESQIRALEATRPGRGATASPNSASLQLLHALSGDVRRPVSSVARDTGRSI